MTWKPPYVIRKYARNHMLDRWKKCVQSVNAALELRSCTYIHMYICNICTYTLAVTLAKNLFQLAAQSWRDLASDASHRAVHRLHGMWKFHVPHSTFFSTRLLEYLKEWLGITKTKLGLTEFEESLTCVIVRACTMVTMALWIPQHLIAHCSSNRRPL